MTTLFTEIALDQTGLLPPLISDYLSQKSALSHLYKYPLSFSSFADVIRDKSKDDTDRALLVEVLKSQYADIPTSAYVTNNIESLSSDKTFTVVASHQPCLFLGPLYNVYKISATINLVEQLKKAFPDYQFVPVFWLGSEDHDTEELNHVNVNGKKIVWKEAGKGAMGRLKTESLGPVIEDLKTLSDNQNIISILETGLRKYDSFGKFTQYLLNEIFKEHGLVILDQDDARLKRRFIEVIKDEVQNMTAFEILKPNVEFLDSNYKAQAKPRELNFFYLGEGFRERLLYNSLTQHYEVINTTLSFTDEQIVEEIENHPERFSPNVIYRPLYQEMILPNLAFVGGAGELSYWLELEPLFDHYQVNYPMQILRPSAALLNASIVKKLEKLDLQVSDFMGDVEQLINRYVKEKLPATAQLNGEKDKIAEMFDLIASKAEAADVTLKQNAAAEKQKALASIENLEAKMLKAEKRKQETAVSQIRSVHASLFPTGLPQERVESLVPFLSMTFIATLIEHLDPFKKNLIVLTSG